LANHSVNDPSVDGWLAFRPANWARPKDQTRCMRENLAPVESIRGLTTRMARGDETAFREFHDGYFTRLFHYLLVISGGREEVCKDALQATLLRVARHARPFDCEATLWSWLTVLARSALVDEERKRQRYRSLLERFLSHFKTTTTPAAGHPPNETLLALLEKNLANLPPGDRTLLESKYYEEQSIKALAADSGSSEKAIESRLGRARRHLKKLILTQLKDEARF
jgi:RNA polymerase sigma-70 factor (ECF subfamily)